MKTLIVSISRFLPGNVALFAIHTNTHKNQETLAMLYSQLAGDLGIVGYSIQQCFYCLVSFGPSLLYLPVKFPNSNDDYSSFESDFFLLCVSMHENARLSSAYITFYDIRFCDILHKLFVSNTIFCIPSVQSRPIVGLDNKKSHMKLNA